MSRITKRNEQYLARVKASMDFERKSREENKRNLSYEKPVTRDNVDIELAKERNYQIRMKNERYSEIWISTCGLSVPVIINVCIRGGDTSMLLNRLEVKVYDKQDGCVKNLNLLNFIQILITKNFPEMKSSSRGQIQIDNYVLPWGIYTFMRNHWLNSGDSRNAQTSEILITEMNTPANVNATSVS